MLWFLLLGLLAGKVVISIMAASPTKLWLDTLGWINRRWLRHKARHLEQALAREADGTGFSARQSFLPQGIGLALDPAHELLFLAEPDGGAAILPYTAVEQVRRGEANISGFYDHYVELTVKDREKSSWRLLCGDNPSLADAVEQALSAARPRGPALACPALACPALA